MSRSDHTVPWEVAVARGECRDSCGGYPCRHFPTHRREAGLRRKHTRRARTALRRDIARGVEPSTSQHRHSAQWDAW
jgi:hypothetical protein